MTDRWTLVSVGRTKRPWAGRTEPTLSDDRPGHDPDCYLCPGNSRAGGEVNPGYEAAFVFTNDFASLLPDTPAQLNSQDPLFRSESVRGTCRVICFTPRHDLSIGTMSSAEVLRTINVWVDQVAELSQEYEWVQVFENRGATMGASSPHPHGQVWAASALPSEPEIEQRTQLEYWRAADSNMLHDYSVEEAESGDRVVVQNQDWLVVVPFWASWPFETIMLPRRSVARLTELEAHERESLALALGETLARYDNLFARPFPYSMGWHGAPGLADAPHWQLHAHFYPPLLRSNVQKFMVGYEMLAEAQRDLSPEEAAERLRAVSGVHYSIAANSMAP